MRTHELTELRKTIASYDAALVLLLEKRFAATRRVGHIKALLDIPIFNAEVEEAKLANIRDSHVKQIFVDIMTESKIQQQTIRCYE